MISKNVRWLAAAVMAFNMFATTPSIVQAGGKGQGRDDADDLPTATPIKHVVVIFQENVSFDHYFGTYPTRFQTRTVQTISPRQRMIRPV
jgi:phospholipase C